jgi:hypothetical protein
MPAGLAAIATAQGGVFRRSQARAAGYSEDAIRHRLATGRWQRVRAGWYVEAALWSARESVDGGLTSLRVAALQRSLGGRSWAAGLTAASLRGARLHEAPTRMTLVADRDSGAGARYGRDYAVVPTALPLHHRSTSRGLDATSPARTIVDVARRHPFVAAVVVADSLLRRTYVNRGDLERVLCDCWNWPGIDAAVAVVGFADGRAESFLESVGRVCLSRHGLHPEPQVQIFDEHGFVARADFLFRAHWTILEVDGLSKYLDQAALVAEKLRQEQLERLGFVVVRATSRDFPAGAAATAERVLQAFEVAEAGRGRRSPYVRLKSTPRFD